MIEGSAVLPGDVAATALVGGETAELEPAALVAVTWTLILAPTSAGPSSMLAEVSPPTATQDAPAELQRCHRYA